MLRTLLAITLALLPTLAAAQPPAAGSTHTFYDPIFVGTVFCDSIDEVRAIVAAEEPEAVYRTFLLQPNARNEPTCAAIMPTGYVVAVVPLGVMERSGKHFRAWAVETRVSSGTGFALYLEYFEMVRA